MKRPAKRPRPAEPEAPAEPGLGEPTSGAEGCSSTMTGWDARGAEAPALVVLLAAKGLGLVEGLEGGLQISI